MGKITLCQVHDFLLLIVPFVCQVLDLLGNFHSKIGIIPQSLSLLNPIRERTLTTLWYESPLCPDSSIPLELILSCRPTFSTYTELILPAIKGEYRIYSQWIQNHTHKHKKNKYNFFCLCAGSS